MMRKKKLVALQKEIEYWKFEKKALEEEIERLKKEYRDLDDKYYKLQNKEKIKAQDATRLWLFGEHE